MPFSLHEAAAGDAAGTITRGAIDCLVRRPGEVIVVEIKTGRPARWHERQLAVYVRAARALFPGDVVSGVLVAPGVPATRVTDA